MRRLSALAVSVQTRKNPTGNLLGFLKNNGQDWGERQRAPRTEAAQMGLKSMGAELLDGCFLGGNCAADVVKLSA